MNPASAFRHGSGIITPSMRTARWREAPKRYCHFNPAPLQR